MGNTLESQEFCQSEKVGTLTQMCSGLHGPEYLQQHSLLRHGQKTGIIKESYKYRHQKGEVVKKMKGKKQ